ncbi:hypothetical protein [Novipirellula caenicola]|uniref:Lipocalin-like domain-containing protein n=1 Tax=Novipirellula caenicola TaxID=1536901 RepID=A0ABP9W1Q7_9BACT
MDYPPIVNYLLGAAFTALLVYWQVLRGKNQKSKPIENRKRIAPTIADLQGQWKVVSFGQNGGKAPFFIPWLVKARLVVEGDRFIKLMGDRTIDSGRLVISTDGDHATFDEYSDAGDDSDNVHLGIIRWVGNKIEHLQGNAGGDRPTGFPYSKDSMCGYAMMKRK